MDGFAFSYEVGVVATFKDMENEHADASAFACIAFVLYHSVEISDGNAERPSDHAHGEVLISVHHE